jgi:hypothetical protein
MSNPVVRWFEKALYASLGCVSIQWLAEYRRLGLRAEGDSDGL